MLLTSSQTPLLSTILWPQRHPHPSLLSQNPEAARSLPEGLKTGSTLDTALNAGVCVGQSQTGHCRTALPSMALPVPTVTKSHDPPPSPPSTYTPRSYVLQKVNGIPKREQGWQQPPV